MIRRSGLRVEIATMFLILISSVVVVAQKQPQKAVEERTSSLPSVIWHDPGDIGSLDLFYGAGGKDHAPDPNAVFTFIEEDMEGAWPKFKVKDIQGVEWKVKMGDEPKSETAATRLMWAMGYFVDEDYYATEIEVKGIPTLRRGNNFISGGRAHNVRLERKPKGVKHVGAWDWFKNPFLNNREFNGLRVMISFLNSWDIKKENNAIYEVDGERRYLVSDLGASLGKTGNFLTHSKGNVEDYTRSSFIERIGSNYVDFTMHTRPFFIEAFDVPYYVETTRLEKVARHIPRADAKWLGEQLSRLSDQQIRDCFRSAGYSSEEIDGFTKAVKHRIAELKAL